MNRTLRAVNTILFFIIFFQLLRIYTDVDFSPETFSRVGWLLIPGILFYLLILYLHSRSQQSSSEVPSRSHRSIAFLVIATLLAPIFLFFITFLRGGDNGWELLAIVILSGIFFIGLALVFIFAFFLHQFVPVMSRVEYGFPGKRWIPTFLLLTIIVVLMYS